MRRTLPLLLCLSLILAGCKAKEAYDQASISKDLDKRGTTDLMKEVADDKYTPPTDGRLTEAQVQMVIKVREHEQKIAAVAKAELKQHAEKADQNKSIGGFMEGMKALGSAADLLTADIRAAKDLGYNTQEYLWVKQQMLAASTAQAAEQVSSAMSESFDKAYQEAKKAHDEAPDEQTKKLYAGVLEGYEKTKQEIAAQKNVDPAVAYNKELISKHENLLNAFANEISKYETKPGEAQQAVDQLEKMGKQQ